MTRLDKFVIALLFALTVMLMVQRQFPAYDPSVGRRPLPPAPPPLAAQPSPPPPVAERVRRPPLGAPGARDPIFTVSTEPLRGGSVLLGTAFSVDPRGVWITARHVASEVCAQLAIVVNGRPTAATMAYLHPESDLAVLSTRGGAPALPLATEPPAIGATGFSFGYPTGVLGSTQDTLMGRSRMQLSGRLVGTTPTLTWSETRRFPDTLETLGGMSGGPMFDQGGRIVGSVVAATLRRGRVHTVAPELLRQVERDTGLVAAAPAPRPVAEIARPSEPLSDMAQALNRDSRIAKVYCRVGS